MLRVRAHGGSLHSIVETVQPPRELGRLVVHPFGVEGGVVRLVGGA